MNPNDVVLIGVIPSRDPDGIVHESFVYSIDAPTNLWCGALCDDGSRMGPEFMAYGINTLISQDKFDIGDEVTVENQVGVKLVFRIAETVSKDSVEAFLAETPTVNKIEVHVLSPTAATAEMN